MKHHDETVVAELRTRALPSTYALAFVIFGIAGLSALSLFVIAGLAALCSLIAALLPPESSAPAGDSLL
jgi:hypothetical protein